MLYTHTFLTNLGDMISVADEHAVYLLMFANTRDVHKKINQLAAHVGCTQITDKQNDITAQVEREIAAYFAGNLQRFTVPYELVGSAFQQTVWRSLANVTYGQTTNYQTQAQLIGNSLAIRAVGAANGKNPLSIILPCHRIIHKNGKIGKYAGGASRKEFLLRHEQSSCK